MDLIGHEDDLQRSIKHMEDSIGLLTKRLDQLSSALVQDVVNAPVIEFAASTFKVEQIVAESHHIDVNFATVPRVDRCTTCHKGIDRKDPTPDETSFREKHKIDAITWSKLAQPLRNHPNLDLFLADTSPHPLSKYGWHNLPLGLGPGNDIFAHGSHTGRRGEAALHVRFLEEAVDQGRKKRG